VGRCGLGTSASGQQPVAGYCERGNEPSCSLKGKEVPPSINSGMVTMSTHFLNLD
jgi:hypothetical protein